ncbi:universal stress protein, partial [Candidatus Bathyarchaeota archaeon]|nr:universal stress protein [Candidatus Bathyarchaeota archaeon]
LKKLKISKTESNCVDEDMIDKQIFKKILVPVDGSHSCLHAKIFASSIAKKFKSKVTVVHVASHEFMHPELKAQYQLPHSILHKIDEAYLETGKKIIRNAEEMFKEANIDVDARLVSYEDPAEFILQLIKDEGYDLVVIGNRAEHQSERYSLGSITEKVARHAECPVLIVKKKPKVAKILAAVDGSKYADQAVEYAVQLARNYSANLALVHVEEDKLVSIGGPPVVDCLGTVGECILKDAATKAQGLTFDKMLEYGSPAEILIKVAKKANVDIIVVGSRGLSSVRRYLLGSVSDDISMHARSSVLIVR